MQDAIKTQENKEILGLIKYTQEERDFMQWCIGLDVSDFSDLSYSLFDKAIGLYLRGDNGLRLGRVYEKNADFDIVLRLGGHLQI